MTELHKKGSIIEQLMASWCTDLMEVSGVPQLALLLLIKASRAIE